MAAQNKLFKRLIWLVDTIYSAGKITREEIDRRWVSSSYNEDHDIEYGERNFHRHKDAVYDMFGIEIVCNRATREYYLANMGDAQRGGVRSWLIDTFAINNMVNLAGNMQNRILFEHIPAGTRYLSSIVSAMKENRKLMITYQRFDRPEPHTFLLVPYCLKVFKQRWYLVGKPDNHPEEKEPRIYALDRVHDIAITDKEGRMPHQFNPTTFFENQFGVDRRITKPEQIRVKMKADAANYMRTLPIHDSQMEIERNENYSIFAFYLAPTYDFVQELRKHGPNLEVLQPEHLREDFKQESASLGRMYWDC